MTARVGLDQDLALAAAHLRVVGRFEAGEAGVVEPDVSEHVRRQLLLRVVAPALLDEADALQLQRLHALRFVGRDLPREIDELRVAAQALRHLLALPRAAVVERAAHELRDLVRVLDFRGIGEDAVGVDAVGEHLAVAVDDLAALGRRGDRAHVLPIGARLHVGVIDDLQVDQPRLDADRPQHEERRRRQDARAQRRPPREVRRGRMRQLAVLRTTS